MKRLGFWINPCQKSHVKVQEICAFSCLVYVVILRVIVWSGDQFFLGCKNMMRVLIERFNRLINPLMCASTLWFVEPFQLDRQLIYAVDLGILVRIVYIVRDVLSWSHNEVRHGVTRYGRGITIGWRSLL